MREKFTPHLFGFAQFSTSFWLLVPVRPNGQGHPLSRTKQDMIFFFTDFCNSHEHEVRDSKK